jgi:hypothetical protein
MLANPILASTPSATSSSLAVQLNWMQHKVMLTNFNMHSPNLGMLRLPFLVQHPSYEFEHCDKTLKKEKKHMSDLPPYPTELIPFQPVDGANTRYWQIYKPISAHPFKEAGIKGFTTPIQPFKVATDVLAQTNQCAAFHWPSLSELNDEIAPFP